jgi:DNA-binding SARP family transcriptional activator/tetratricopeptide (TPR) repeat protein
VSHEASRLSIRLLGPFRVTLDGQPITGFVSDKARALLAYLAVEAERPHRRESLVGLLWTDYPEQDARTSLRTALANVRKRIGDREASPPFLQITHQTIQFNLASDSWIDVVALTRLLPTGGYPQQPDPQAVTQWENAVDLYKGQFLEGFSIADSPLFEEWALLERESLERQVLEALDLLVEWHEGCSQVERALHYARRQVDLDPLRESAHRQLMRLLAISGQRAAALAQYETCRRVLRKELHVEPDELTSALCEQIRTGEIEARPTAPAPLPAYAQPPPPDPATLPDPGPLPPGSRLPFTRNVLFTGRHEPLLAQASALLYAPSGPSLITQAVSGMGGIGKTQLAVEFAYRYGRFSGGVHWLDARDPALLEAEVAACGLAMALPNWPEKQSEQVAFTLAVWHQSSPRLVILDNLEDVAAAREWLARLGTSPVRLLLTARRTDWPRDLGLSPLPLAVFTPHEAHAFLRRYLPETRTSDSEIAVLAAHLGHLPLALQLAARYLDGHPRLTVGEYMAQLEGVLAHPSMQAWRSDLGDPVGHDLDLAATFFSSWQEITDESARRLFLICGYCAPNQPIPCRLLERAAGLDGTGCDEALTLLTGLGLLTPGPPAAGSTIHPLLAEYAESLARGASADEFAPLPALAAALAELCTEANQGGLPARFYPLRPHLEAVLPAADAIGLEQAAELWNELGVHLRHVADYPRARTALERALAIDERALGPEHPDVASDLSNLSLVLWNLGDLTGARAALERALAIDERDLGPDHPYISIDLNNLGLVLKALGDLAGARAAFERALAIDEQAHGPDHSHVATVLCNLGPVLQDLGDLAGARAALERALAVDEHAYGPDHPHVATDVNNLGVLLWTLDDLAGARATLERALTIRDRVLGRHHPDTARSLGWLGTLDATSGDLASARSRLQEAVTILHDFLPADHPDIRRLEEQLARLS